MRTVHTFYGITADISEERIIDYNKDLSGFLSLSQKLEEFAKIDSSYIRAFLARRGYKGLAGTIRMLEAHGYSDTSHGFLYADLAENRLVWEPVDCWLDKHDGKYEILFVSCCNAGRFVLKQRTSMIIYPLGQYAGELAKEIALDEKSETLKILHPKDPPKSK